MHEIHRGAPELSLLVKLGALLHEVANVSYVHSDLIYAVSDLFDAQCVIEVLRCNRVNCKDALVSQIKTQLDLFLRNAPLSSCLIYVFGENSEGLVDFLVKFLTLCLILI